jgi:hypothetical protein
MQQSALELIIIIIIIINVIIYSVQLIIRPHILDKDKSAAVPWCPVPAALPYSEYMQSMIWQQHQRWAPLPCQRTLGCATLLQHSIWSVKRPGGYVQAIMMPVNIHCPVLESKGISLAQWPAVRLDGSFAKFATEQGSPCLLSPVLSIVWALFWLGGCSKGNPLLPHGTQCHFCS